MSLTVRRPARSKFSPFGLHPSEKIHYQLSSEELVLQSVQRGEGVLNDTGALVIHTGEFTGRSPKDKFIVEDEITKGTINWNEFNLPIKEKYYDIIFNRITQYLDSLSECWIRDCYACADSDYRLSIRVITETPALNLFAHNMFLRPSEKELDSFEPDWHIISVPGLKLDATTCGTRQHNGAVISFKHKTILIAGTKYTGEMKKGVFSILNYILPHEKNVLSMHCAANIGNQGDTAIFFGLSGTGKTTLSADPQRKLIGDDEHGWTMDKVFNFEGGCYAKCIHLDREKEPEIFDAIRAGALVENVTFFPNSRSINFASGAITENTRVSYPLHFIRNSIEPSIGQIPKNIFFLTCDAYGVLPPISKLTAGQAMYHFISGYTAKVAGTETGISEPKSTFSACFGAPFLPLHPTVYARMLGQKMVSGQVNVWLVNTGWTGGPYLKGSRIPLSYTRSMVTAALNRDLDGVEYITHPVFGMNIPKTCPGVPADLLNPVNTWENKEAYHLQERALAEKFIKNFTQYAREASEEIIASGPKI